MSLRNINEAFERKFNEITDSYNNESNILESLRNLLRNLNEAEMSPEDRRESDLIRSAYAKIQKRSNARLTPEEQAVLDKYGLVRDWDKKIHYKVDNPRVRDNTAIVDNPEDERSHGQEIGSWVRPRKPDGSKDYSRDSYRLDTKDPSKINYADRARKRPERTKNRSFDYTYADSSYLRGDRAWDDTGLIDYNRGNNDERIPWYERSASRGVSQNTAISRMSQSKLAKMKGALGTRKEAQQELDNAQAEFDRRKADADVRYMQKMQDAERDYDYSMKYAKDKFSRDSDPSKRDRAQDEIDTLLKRKKTEAVDLSDKEGSITNALTNDSSWKNASTPKELADKVKEILDKKSIDTKASRSLIKRLEGKRNLADALFTIWNSVLAGSGEAVIK